MWGMVTLVLAVIYMIFGYLEYVEGHMSLRWLSGYTSPMMVIYSVAIFLWIKELSCLFNRFLQLGGGKFSRDSFGIYVFHMLWVNVIYKVVKFNPIAEGLWTLIPVLIMVTLLAWGTTIVFRKIPYIGKYI
jgi:surface polysaccharide O-acyltransferase-like enzyme